MRVLIFLVCAGAVGLALVASGTPKSCQEPEVIGKVPEEMVRRAKIRCGFKYPRSPCLKSIELRPSGTYWVVCRAEVD